MTETKSPKPPELREQKARAAQLRRRLVEISGAPPELLTGEKTAKEFVELAVELSGCGPAQAGAEPDWCGQAQAIRGAFDAKYRESQSAEAAYAEALAVIREQTGKRLPVAATDVDGEMPRRLLWLADKDTEYSGAVLSEGTVCLLAGEGGMSKTTLALQIALFTAARSVAPNAWAEKRRGWCAGLEGEPGPVLFAGYEDESAVCRWRLDRLIGTLEGDSAAAARAGLAKLHFLDMPGRPLYGPPPGYGYNHRPGPLEGWWDLREAALRLRPVLLVIDPALGSYVGEPNAPQAVREFLSALNALAAEFGGGVLLLAHSTKAARRSIDKFDPGHIGGSAAWHDGARGAMILARGEDGGRVLRVSKANYGPAYRSVLLDPISRTVGGAPLGFEAGGVWAAEAGSRASEAPLNGGAKAAASAREGRW